MEKLHRAIDECYQMVSGHHRLEAAKRANFEKIPAWVVDIFEEEAFYELVRSNNQGELSPLEIGIHALEAVPPSEGGRGKSGGLSEYAKAIGKGKARISTYRTAASVIRKINCSDIGTVLTKANHLATIGKAPESEWQYLTEQLIEQDWSVKKTESVVEAINSIVDVGCPDWAETVLDFEDWKQKAQFVIIEMRLKLQKTSRTSAKFWIKLII